VGECTCERERAKNPLELHGAAILRFRMSDLSPMRTLIGNRNLGRIPGSAALKFHLFSQILDQGCDTLRSILDSMLPHDRAACVREIFC